VDGTASGGTPKWIRQIDDNVRHEKGAPQPTERGRTAVVFVKAEDFLKPLGLPQNDKNIYAMVINRRGEMLNYAVGEYSDEKAKALRPFLKND
jgi:hypothetical protein